MKDIRQLHREAMIFAKQASEALANQNTVDYLKLASQAFELERSAALELIQEFESEPTRSVLFRSAASIGYNIGNYSESFKLSHLGLAGNPYDEIKEELQVLLEAATNAIETNASKVIGIENAYIENLRESAVNIKLEPTENRYSKAIVIDYISDFLKNIQTCFSNFSEVNFRRTFKSSDFTDYTKTLNLFKKDTKALCVGLRFKSFGVSVAVDTSLQNYREITSPKFKIFKNTLFDEFKEEVLLADFNSIHFQNKIEKKYTDQERNQIFSSIVDSYREKSKYRISIVDKEFKNEIKPSQIVNKKAIAILKPAMEKDVHFDDTDVLLRRTFELTNTAGHKGEKILSENLEYAELRVRLENLNFSDKNAYFVTPYEQRVIFDRGNFFIDDEYYKIYVEADNFKEAERLFAIELISKFSFLLELEEEAIAQKTELSVDAKSLIDIYKSTIVKGW